MGTISSKWQQCRGGWLPEYVYLCRYCRVRGVSVVVVVAGVPSIWKLPLSSRCGSNLVRVRLRVRCLGSGYG